MPPPARPGGITVHHLRRRFSGGWEGREERRGDPEITTVSLLSADLIRTAGPAGLVTVLAVQQSVVLLSRERRERERATHYIINAAAAPTLGLININSATERGNLLSQLRDLIRPRLTRGQNQPASTLQADEENIQIVLLSSSLVGDFLFISCRQELSGWDRSKLEKVLTFRREN